MSAHGERQLILHLLDADSLAVIVREGMDEECVPTEELRGIYNWALDRFYRGGMTLAPSREMVTEEWEEELETFEIDLEETPTDSIETVIDDLKGSYIHRYAQEFNKKLASDVAGATTSEKVEVLGYYASELVRLSLRLESREYMVDARDGLSNRLMEYDKRSLDKEAYIGMGFGIPEIDNYTRGIHPGELAIVAAGPKTGKALATGTKVLTPFGWKIIDDIVPGDEVIGSEGKPIKVLNWVKWEGRPLLKVRTQDGGEVVVDSAHEWTINPHSHEGRQQIVDTATLGQKIKTNDRFAYLPLPNSVEFNGQPELPLDPYLLGLLLGDGGFRSSTPTITSADEEIHRLVVDLLPPNMLSKPVSKYTNVLVKKSLSGGGQVPNPLTKILRDLGIWGHRSEMKFIPDLYMYSKPEDRLSILQGLMDTDGGVDGKSRSFSSSSERLARQVQEIAWSLGGTATLRFKINKKAGLDSWRVSLRLPEGMSAFRLGRKIEGLDNRGSDRMRPPSRKIVEVSDAGVGDSICIEVDAEDHLFITEGYMLTRNSMWAALVALKEWQQGKTVMFYTLENSIEMTEDRIVTFATGINAREWQQGKLDDFDRDRVESLVEEMRDSATPLYITQPAPGAPRSVEALVRQAQVLGADSLIIDQLSHIQPKDERQPRNFQVREILHQLRNMISTGRDRMPCLLFHQINRDGVRAADKENHLKMDHLAESADAERTADWVFGLHRSHSEVMMNLAKFQTLASRREQLEHFMLLWNVSHGQIAYRSPWRPT